MATVNLNGVVFQGVEVKFLEIVAARLQTELLRQTHSNRLSIDGLVVKAELVRMYTSAIQTKPWFRDFIIQFCRDRSIPCPPKESL
jgi:hypothetical protein